MHIHIYQCMYIYIRIYQCKCPRIYTSASHKSRHKWYKRDRYTNDFITSIFFMCSDGDSSNSKRSKNNNSMSDSSYNGETKVEI